MRLPSIARDVILATTVATLPAILAVSVPAVIAPAIAYDASVVASAVSAVIDYVAPVTLAACTLEDGSQVGQSFPCLWDAATMGNGRGDSYILTGPADLDPPSYN